jgi:ribonuclease R
LSKHIKQYRATIQKNKRGFGFLVFDSRDFEDLFVPPDTAQQYFHGDRLEVSMDSKGHVQEFTLIEHRFKEIVGVVQSGFIIYERRNAYEAIPIKGDLKGTKNGDWVRASLNFPDQHSQSETLTATLLDKFGDRFPGSVDLRMIASEYNLFPEPSEEAIEQAETLKLDLTAELKGRRKDHRKIPLITIDGETARDFDDAVYVEKNKKGYSLWVAIADVSHYVTEDTPLDKDAYARGTSVYFPERAFHMLPSNLSEHLCSLKPHEPRLALTCIMDFDRTGKMLNIEVVESLIESKRRATYTEIHNEMLANKNNPKWEFAPHFELYHLLRKSRTERGSIDFEFPESQILVDDQGEPTEVKMLERRDSHRLIEEFMIAANEAVTQWMLKKKWPFVYRIHETPSAQGLEKFQKTASSVGIKLDLRTGKVTPKLIAALAVQFQTHPAKTLLNFGLLRAMKQAIYTAKHDIHFGLASEGYTHFTSPIRRYPDLIVHRLLKEALYRQAKEFNFKKLTQKLELQTEHCSYRERLADSAERDMDRLKKVRYMTHKLGENYMGTIVGMNERGMFVQLDDPYIEGFLPKEALTDDVYQYIEAKIFFSGKNKRKVHRVGDRIEILVARASLEKREIEFALPGADLSKPTSKGPPADFYSQKPSADRPMRSENTNKPKHQKGRDFVRGRASKGKGRRGRR